MELQPDFVGSAFFALGALLLAAFTRWPALWVAVSLRRRMTRERLVRKATDLRILTGLGSLGSAVMAVVFLRGS